jgi:thiamine kinase-like enzyme
MKDESMPPHPEFFADISTRFDLGTPIAPVVAISGGLSNRLYRLETDQGVFAVKRMVANADAPAFKANVEAAFVAEQRAREAGIPMPEPVPSADLGEALSRIMDREKPCWVRVHRWVDASVITPDDVRPADRARVASILATMHRLSYPDDPSPATYAASRDWTSALPAALNQPALIDAIVRLEEIVHRGYATAASARVLSHRDLDAKNLLRTTGGDLIVIDWDAAGPVVAQWDVAGVAMDWSGIREGRFSPEAVGQFLRDYTAAGGHTAPISPESFAGWAEGVLDWLWFNLERSQASDPAERALGQAEVIASTLFIPDAARWISGR